MRIVLSTVALSLYAGSLLAAESLDSGAARARADGLARITAADGAPR